MAHDIVIFLHGRGQEPGSASAVVYAFPGVDFMAPEGGVTLRRGRTWFLNQTIGIAREESVAAAESAFMQWSQKHDLEDRKVWLCGFSNGGAFAAHLLLKHPEQFAGAALLCAPLVLPPWPSGVLNGKPVFYAHGDEEDAVVPQSYFREAEDFLRLRSGSRLTLRRYSAGHVISTEMVTDLSQWFRDARIS